MDFTFEIFQITEVGKIGVRFADDRVRAHALGGFQRGVGGRRDAAGATTHYAVDTSYEPAIRAAVETFTVVFQQREAARAAAEADRAAAVAAAEAAAAAKAEKSAAKNAGEQAKLRQAIAASGGVKFEIARFSNVSVHGVSNYYIKFPTPQGLLRCLPALAAAGTRPRSGGSSTYATYSRSKLSVLKSRCLL